MASKIASEPLIYDFYSLLLKVLSFSFKDDEMSFFCFFGWMHSVDTRKSSQ